ncbi:hypothetical protein [Burkholderia stabilis]|uniref:hypothetical protein n=1 Tax=Burkholderia stabilis TaxID=95485 RepID=UPI001588D461|nr:hypothetical protein [Burkholderia stabilis]
METYDYVVPRIVAGNASAACSVKGAHVTGPPEQRAGDMMQVCGARVDALAG